MTISANYQFLDLLNTSHRDLRVPYTYLSYYCGRTHVLSRGTMGFSAALDEVVQEAGLTALKPKQREAIEGIVSGNTFCGGTTGYGKSIVYALLPSLYDKLLGKSVVL